MFTISLPAFLTILGLVLGGTVYVVRISYRMGALEQRVASAEKTIEKMQDGHATKDDFNTLKESIEDIKKNIGKLFDLIREQSLPKS